MIVLTELGFFSVTNGNMPGYFNVESMLEKDMYKFARLARELTEDHSYRFKELNQYATYNFYMRIPKGLYLEIIQRISQGIDYTNLGDRLIKINGKNMNLVDALEQITMALQKQIDPTSERYDEWLTERDLIEKEDEFICKNNTNGNK